MSFLKKLNLFWRFRIANAIAVKIDYPETNAMLHLAFAEIVQEWLPVAVMFQVFSHVSGQKNMSGITAIHHSLRDVNSGAGNISLLIQIADFVNGSAVNTHPQPQPRIFF